MNRSSRLRAISGCIKIVLISSLLLAWSGLQVSAQTNAPHPAPQVPPAPQAPQTANRYLFMIETSRAMKSRSDGVLKVMEDLIGSGVSGQLRRGDTIAVWTFNADLYAGKFPLQQWTPDTQKAVAVRILSFLKEQPYEKSASLQKALLSMDMVVKKSDFLTVILISDGEDPIVGTPFDVQINSLYRAWDKEQQKAHMPFVTVLRATGGKITHFTVTSAPWPVDMPPFPNELLLASTNSPAKTNANVDSKTNAPVAKKPPPVGQPLIISGKKRLPAETTKAPDSGATNSLPGTNLTVGAVKSDNPRPITPAENPTLLTNISPQTPVPARISENLTTQPAPIVPQPAPGLQKGEPGSSPAVAATNGVPIIVKPTPTPETAPTAAPVSRPPEPIVVATSESPSNSAAVAAPSDRGGPTTSASPAGAESVVPAQPIQAGKSLWIAGSILGVIVLAVIMLRMRRTRSVAASSSLITRSFERERKP